MALLFPCKKAGGIGVASLAITTAPTKTTYAQYDSLDLTGLEVTATFKDGLVADVTDLCQITPADGSELNDYGNLDITIKYANKTVTQSITVNQMTAIAVTTQPTKTIYLVGENLDLTGIAVTATAGALIRNVTNLANYSPPNGTQLNTLGTQRVNVEFADVNTHFDVNVIIRSLLKKIPYDYSYSAAVVYNNEIHILGSNTSPNYQNHYKWNGSNWVSVSTLPYKFCSGGCAVVYNNEIHILGGYYGKTNHYKWDGSDWSSVSTIPINFSSSCAVVYNNEIHILGSDNGNKHYKWNGSNWVSASSSNFGNTIDGGCAVVYNNEIHAFPYKEHWKWNGSTWTNVGTTGYSAINAKTVVYNNAIHFLGGNGDATIHRKWDGSSWSNVSTLPYEFMGGSAVVWNSNVQEEIVILGSSSTKEYKRYDAQWDGTTWTVGSD